jgi:hypothetical protein
MLEVFDKNNQKPFFFNEKFSFILKKGEKSYIMQLRKGLIK